MKVSNFSRESNSKFENCLLYFAHIFSAGFSSGLYGGKKMRAIFSGIISFFALWKAPLSSTTILNSSGFWFDKLFKKIWKFSPLQLGSISCKLSPVMGEKAPKR